jgi:hypothetical protein
MEADAIWAVNSSTVTIGPNITQQQKQIYTIPTRGEEKKGWWTKPIGIIGLGVAVKFISSFLGMHYAD